MSNHKQTAGSRKLSVFSQAGNHSTEDKEQMIDEIMAELEG